MYQSKFRFTIITLLMSVLLTACEIDLSLNEDGTGIVIVESDVEAAIGGSIGDGPVVGATVIIKDVNGDVIKAETIDSTNYDYKIKVKAGNKSYPLTIEAVGGTDIVSNATLDLPLISVSLSPSIKWVNINPFTTLVVMTAQAMPGGLQQDNIDSALISVLEELNFGFDTAIIENPFNSLVTASNAAVMVKASEALGEMVRRTQESLLIVGNNMTTADVMTALAADLVDGALDGSGSQNADPRISATAKVVSAQVLLEALSNHLKVGGVEATTALDNSILFIQPDAPLNATAQVRISERMILQTRRAIASAIAIAPSSALTDIDTALSTIIPASLPSAIELILPPSSADEIATAITRIPSASSAELEAVNHEIILPNHAPTISGTPASSVTEGNAYSFQPAANDLDGDTLSFTITNKPVWASFNATSGLLSGTPNASHVGITSNIVIAVNDGQESVSLSGFSITVIAAPVGGTFDLVTTSYTVAEGAAVSVTITRSNASGEASVSYGTHGVTAVSDTLGGDDYAGVDPIILIFADGEVSKNVTVQTLDNLIVESDELFEVYLTSPSANYTLGAATVATVTITDNDVATNQAPTISGTPATSVTEGSAYSFQPAANDLDGDTLSFTITNKPVWASFDANSGLLSGTPNASHVGITSNIVIAVSDGQESVSLSGFSITVIAAPVGGTFDLATTSYTVAEGAAISVTITRSNASGEASVSYGTHGVTAVSDTLGGDDYAGFDPAILIFADGEVSKNVTVQTLDNLIVESDEIFEIYLTSPSANYTLGAATVATVTITDNDVATNQAPTISGIPATSVTEGSAYNFQPAANDLDGDSLSFSITNKPVWASFNTSTGQLSGTPNSSDVGNYAGIVISVSDGQESVSLSSFAITVQSNIAATGTASLSWSAPATKEDGSPLVLSEIAGYRVYYGSSIDTLLLVDDINDYSITDYAFNNLSQGTHFFAITVYDTYGDESALSNVASKTIL